MSRPLAHSLSRSFTDRNVAYLPSPILYRFFYLLTPPSELPSLPPALQGYASVHVYTVLQVIVTVAILIITFTPAAPVFPVLIIALVPLRLLGMRRLWNRETLRFVDAWACREGTPEDQEDQTQRDCNEIADHAAGNPGGSTRDV